MVILFGAHKIIRQEINDKAFESPVTERPSGLNIQ